jgi:hypothetical protein
MAQVVEHLPNRLKAPSSNPSTAKKKCIYENINFDSKSLVRRKKLNRIWMLYPPSQFLKNESSGCIEHSFNLFTPY